MSVAPDVEVDPTLGQYGDLDRAALERLGIRYETHEALPLDTLDDAASRAVWHQARLGEPVNEEYVEQILAELRRGVEFPPIIFYRDESGKAATLSGNHRRRAHGLAGRATIRAYEATGLKGLRNEDALVLRLIYEANHGHGMPVAGDDRVRQAIALVEHGFTIRAAAAAVGMPENRVRDQYEISRATRRLEDHGIDTTPIRISNQRRLANIRSDTILTEAAKLVPLMHKQTEEVNDLVKAINEQRTEDAQLGVVREFEESLRAGATSATDPRNAGAEGIAAAVRRFDSAVGSIARFDVESLRSGIPAEYRARLAARIRDASATLAAAESLL